MGRNSAISGITLDRGLTWRPHIHQVRQISQTRRYEPSYESAKLYMQLTRPMVDYACPVWRHVAPAHLKLLQVIQSKCLCSAMGAPLHVSNLQIQQDLGVPYLAEHIRNITQSLYSTFPDAENPLFRNLGGTSPTQGTSENSSKPARGYKILSRPPVQMEFP